ELAWTLGDEYPQPVPRLARDRHVRRPQQATGPPVLTHPSVQPYVALAGLHAAVQGVALTGEGAGRASDRQDRGVRGARRGPAPGYEERAGRGRGRGRDGEHVQEGALNLQP